MKAIAQWLTTENNYGKQVDLYEVRGNFDLENINPSDEKACDAHFQSVLNRSEIIELRKKFPADSKFFLQDASDSASGNRIQYLLRIRVPAPNKLPEIIES